MTYRVSIEKNGVQTHVGTLRGDRPENTVFSYALAYLAAEDAAPISLSLPLQEAAFSPAQTKNYFDSLLPEGYTRRTVAQWIHADEDDYLTILHALGCECLGALQITAEDETHGASYEPLALDQVKALAAEGASKSAELVISSHLSLAGATGKVGLYFDGKNWYLPRGTAPSTHIVKQSHVRLKHIVQNEQLAMTTARNCGLQVADSFIINTGSGADEEILLAAGRYDRSFSNAGRVIDDLTAPLRLHQEDFAQALGIPASRKYERAGEDHMARITKVFTKCDFPESSSILDLITSNIHKEKRPFSRNWIDAFTDSVFNSEEVFQPPDITRPQLLTWQEEYLFEMLSISIRDEGVVSLFAEKYATKPDYHKWIKEITENMIEFFSGEKVLFVIDTIRFITCEIEMSTETTVLHLDHLVSQMKHWENSSFLFCSPLAIYKLLNEKGWLNSTDYGPSLRALKEASISISDIGVLRKREDCSVPLDSSCKKRIKEYYEQKCERTANETDPNQFIKGLSDTFVQYHVTEQQFSKIYISFCKMVDSVDQRYSVK